MTKPSIGEARGGQAAWKAKGIEGSVERGKVHLMLSSLTFNDARHGPRTGLLEMELRKHESDTFP